ncbi:transcription factor cwo isoform X2 [Aplysia californica]|uniref:Transcription factor cwo isoform X2 n=1 Tax=Aplysia californica TaxID=6500 RepID=A0ABM0ZVE4_APLCA|nr:transcription factor cwo isoform X2 [Aplysia californica]
MTEKSKHQLGEDLPDISSWRQLCWSKVAMEGEESNQSLMDESGIKRAKRAKMEAAETDRLLNFATAADELELSLKRQKMPRDPMSHRIIEKRRRDRMNNCLADLSRLIPSSYHKQGQGRIEKTEIIEMAIKHINMLQQRVDESEKRAQDDKPPPQPPPPSDQRCCATKFYMGFKEAQDEVMRFLVEVESVSAMDPFCKKIMKHLENASKKFITEHVPHHSRLRPGELDKQELDNDNSGQPAFLQSSSAFYESSPVVGRVGQEEQGLAVDSKHRDKHLRSLLADQQHSVVSSQGSGSVSETGSNGLVPLFSYSSQMTSIGGSADPSGMGSSGYVSDLSNTEKTSPNSSTSSRDNVYKFKHNITKRFSQEGHHMQQHHHHHHHHLHNGQPSDTSSSTSSRDLEDDQRQLKWKGTKHKARHSGLDSADTLYRDDVEASSNGNNSVNSDEFNSASVSSGDCKRRRNSGKTSAQSPGPPTLNGESRSNTSSFILPGFILHPSGTHYMPISVQNTNISGLLDNSLDNEGPPVFHPISIPVHFRRPVI